MSRPSGWPAAALWGALAIVGQAAALSLVVAGHGVGYQHYLPVSSLGSRPFGVAVIALQAVTVAWGLRGMLATLVTRAHGLLPGWRLAAFAGAMFLSSATVGRELPRYAGELLVSSLIQLISLATIVLAVRAIPDSVLGALRGRFDRLLGDEVAGDEAARPRVDRFAVVVAVAVTALCALLSVVVYGRHPHLQDEVAYLFQARTFASGRLALPTPPVPRAFALYLIDAGPRGWYSPVPPGWALILALGVPFGLPWLVNPLLTGANIILCYLVLQPLYGRRTARLATLLLAVSPWNLFLGMSLMPHALTLCCALAASLGVMEARRTDQARWAWLGGAALGLIAAARQLDAMVMAAALGLWAIGLGGRRLRLSGTAGLVLGSLAVAAPLLVYNQHFTGRASTFPIMVYNDAIYGKGANDYGFGKNRGMGWAIDPNPGHDPIDGAINANLNTTVTQVELFGWSTGSLLLVYAFVLVGGLARADRLMLGVIGLTFIAYFFNYFSGGPDFGARYWFLMIVPGTALTARGALTLGERLPDAVRGTPRILAAVAWLVAAASLTFVPWRSVNKYYRYGGMRPDVRSLAENHRFGNGLVIVSGPEVPDYASAATYNPLDLGADAPVYAWHRDPATDGALVAAFPNRSIWLVDGPTVTGQGYVVRAGPLARSEALRLLNGQSPPQ